MDKKEYILKVLTSLEGKRPLAAGLKILVEGNTLGDSTIDALLSIFKSAIKEISDIKIKASLQKGHDVLMKMKEIEAAQHEKEINEINDLLNSI